ncbi:polyphenol oxidase family protein [bacterium]|nr:polyphenol oxidase family protein [bacterium]
MSTFQDTQTTSENQIKASCWQPFPDIEWVSGGISILADGAMAWGHAPDHEIAANRRGFIMKTGCLPQQAVAIDQVHGVEIVRVAKSDANRGINSPESRIPATDGMITNTPDLVLVTSHADCAPLFLLDDKHRAIGLVHAGWKGILAGIAGKAIRSMHSEFKTDASDLRVAVGPMISSSYYEVSDDLASRFTNRFGVQVVNRMNERPHLDLFSCLMIDSLRHGLDPARIPHRPPCTFRDSRYSSFRREGVRMKGMIAGFRIHA